MAARVEPRRAARLSTPLSVTTLLLFPALFSSDGGIERILRLYLKATCELAGTEDRVELIVLNDHALPADKLAPFATSALARGPVACGRKKLVCAWQALSRARRIDRLICGHINLIGLARLAQRLSRKLEVWLVAHGTEVWRGFSAAEQEALRAATGILCVSDYTRRELAARCPGLDATRLHVQPNALDPQFEAPLAGHVTKSGAILTVSRLCRDDAYKGIDDLIRAVPTIRQNIPQARLTVIGDGDDRERLEALAQELAPGAVTFAGRVTDRQLREALATCELFALPSRGEGFGLVYLEAMAHGKPCLAVAAAGAPEVVDPRSGVLAQPGNAADIAAHASAALARSWDSSAIRARAMEFAYPRFKARLGHALAA